MSGRLTVVLALLLALLGLGGGYYWLFVRPQQRSEQVKPPTPETLVLRKLSGQVEVAGASGDFHTARLGERLGPADRIRTDAEGEAELHGSEGSVVRLLP